MVEALTADPERNYLVEAQMLLKGLTGLLPQLDHLKALEEHYEVRLIQVANDMEQLKRKRSMAPRNRLFT